MGKNGGEDKSELTPRTLVREPLKVKRMTRTGKPVQVTDNGEPLWIIQPQTWRVV
jgi:hypothetical protein